MRPLREKRVRVTKITPGKVYDNSHVKNIYPEDRCFNKSIEEHQAISILLKQL